MKQKMKKKMKITYVDWKIQISNIKSHRSNICRDKHLESPAVKLYNDTEINIGRAGLD